MKLIVNVSLQRFDARIAAVRAKIQNPDNMLAIAKAGADIFEAEEKTLAPVADGDLRASIHQEVIESSSTRARIAVGPDAPHAKRIEFGYKGPDKLGRHFHQRPHSYIRAAHDAKEQEARQAMKDTGNEIVREALKP